MFIYLCTKVSILLKDIALKPFFKVEIFSKLKRAITPPKIGGFTLNRTWSTFFMIIYLCIKFRSIHQSFQKISHGNQKCYERDERDGRDGRTYGQRWYYMPPIENGGGIKIILSTAKFVRRVVKYIHTGVLQLDRSLISFSSGTEIYLQRII